MLDHPARREANLRVPAPGIAPMFNAFNPATAYAEFWRKSAFVLGGNVAQSWLHFLGERWLKDLEFPQQVASCQTAADLNVAVSQFWQEAAKDYSAEFNEIADLAWAAMRSSIDGPCDAKGGDACCGKCSSN